MVSATQTLRNSGLFRELSTQEDGEVCFQVIGPDGRVTLGASIYVQPNDREIHIRTRALENGKFPNNARLFDYVRLHSYGMARSEGNPSHAYRVAASRLDRIAEIIRSGRGS